MVQGYVNGNRINMIKLKSSSLMNKNKKFLFFLYTKQDGYQMTKKREATKLNHPIWSHVAIIKYQMVFQFF